MRLSEDKLIERLNLWVPKLPGFGGNRLPAPPVTEPELLAAEAALGFTLPHLLRRLYLEISDGDFGPRLLRLNEQQPAHDWDFPDSIVFWYVVDQSMNQEKRDNAWKREDERKLFIWPEKLLAICDWGCAIYSCLDCSKPECPVLRCDGSTVSREFAVEAPSFHEWLEAWLDGKQLFWLDWEQAEKVVF